MRRLRTLPTRRLWGVAAVVALVAAMAGIAQAALSSSPKPAPKALANAIYDALHAPQAQGITARVHFTNNLLPSGALPQGAVSPLASGADGRLWVTRDGRARVELQSDSGDAQIVLDDQHLTVYDASSNTVYRVALPADQGQAKAKPDHEPTLARIKAGLGELARQWNLSGARPTSTAGQPTYTVRITPKDDGGLLGAAQLAWDAANGVPLRVAVYAQGQPAPVLELKATDVSFGRVSAKDVTLSPPAGAKTVDITPPAASGAKSDHKTVSGLNAVRARLSFPLAAPAKLAGLPRQEVRLTQSGSEAGAIVTYGQGLGAIIVFEHKADGAKPLGPGGRQGLQLPKINIGGATGSELATALGTFVTFERAGVQYIVVGSVPPAAAENAARGLR